MKRIFLVLSSLTLGVSVFAAPQARFVNRGIITNAIPIDAIVVENRGVFTNIQTTEFPYEMSNVRYFTNAINARMHGSTGFRFETILDTFGPQPRRPLISFNNQSDASISATDSGLALSGFGGIFLNTTIGTASRIEVKATNLINRGNLSVGNVGLIELTGNNVNLSRGSIIAGQFSGTDTNLDDFLFTGFGLNSFGVEEIYGGAGPQTIELNPTNLNTFNSLGYFPPNGVFSPIHNVQFRAGPGSAGPLGFFQAGSISLPVTFPSDFEAHTFITPRFTPRGVDQQIQVVFVKTNFIDANLQANVRFGPSDVTVNPFAQTAVVEFSTKDFDPVSGADVTNAIYFIDSSAEFGNIFAITNFFGNSSVRPSSYRITTSTPYPWIFGDTSNVPYDPSLIFPGNRYIDSTVEATYAGYAAKVGRNPETASGLGGFTNFFDFTFVGFGGFTNLDELILFPDPTNQPGRIEITADVLDLTLARIRAEGLLSLKAKHLTGGGAFGVSAGIINADLGSTNGLLVISNVFSSKFNRVRGDLYAYSAIWDNTETNNLPDPNGFFPDGYTNNNSFHVLILDHNLRSEFTATIRDLTLRATNVVIKNDLTINRSVHFITENLTFGGPMSSGSNIVITLTEGATTFGAANLVGVKNFLNEANSTFQGANEATFGYDETKGFDSIINRGTIIATAPYFKATLFENSGSIFADNSIDIQAGTIDLSGGTNQADFGIYLSAGSLIVPNTTITAGQLVLNVTNLITDFGPGANNIWQVTDGFQLLRKPFQGDLLGTEIRTIATGFNEVQHIWAGEDAGPGPDGFVNNVAIGRLILDIQNANATLRFSAAGFQNALYVINLDLNFGPGIDINSPLNDLIKIDPNFRIYFINSNAGDKLTTTFPNVIQVEDFNLLAGDSPLVVRANGLGIITPNLNGKNLETGREYKMKAVPGAGQIFTGWSGGTNANDSSLTFKMRRNLVLQANFGRNPLNGVKGAYNGLYFDATNGVTHESSGFFKFIATKKGVVTGKIISGKSYRFKGQFNSAGFAEILVARAGKSPLNVKLQLDLDNDSGEVTGSVTADGWTAGLRGDLAKSNPFPVLQSDLYTMVISGSTNSATAPGGNGFGTIKADSAGGMHFKGMLADGTKFNQRVAISRSGEVPFYLSLYRSSGSLLSWIQFTNDIFSSVSGHVSWIKKASAQGIYRSGFTNLGEVVGSSYSPPAVGSRVVDIIQGTVTLNGGNLNADQTNTVELGTDNVMTVTTGENQLSLKISLPTGLLNGSFVHPQTQKKTLINGIVLQQQKDVRGFFLGTNQSGGVVLESN